MGRNEAVMHMFKEIKKPEKAEKWINNALNKRKLLWVLDTEYTEVVTREFRQ